MPTARFVPPADPLPEDLGRISAHELLERYSNGERFFYGADLSGESLVGADLSDADLSHATLVGADLSGADLSGARFWSRGPSYADFTRADLTDACLIEAHLPFACFWGANCAMTDFTDADLFGADFLDADLTHATLQGTDLRGSSLARACLDHAKVLHATLDETDLTGAMCMETNITGSSLLDMDLSPLLDGNVRILQPCKVDHRSILRSAHHHGLEDFLRRTGMPEVFVLYGLECARSLDERGIFQLLQSTFISYGALDEVFATRLSKALREQGVATFFFPEDAVPGKKLHRQMREGVNDHDRVILVCSETSLVRPGVLNEIEETLQREARDGGREYLIPVGLDEFVFTDGWASDRPDMRQAVCDRVVADFSGTDGDAAEAKAKFRRQLARLVRALRR